MKNLSPFLIITIVIFLSSCIQNPAKRIQFLEGTWKIEGKEQYEVWEQNGKDALKGHAWKYDGKQKKILETLAIKKAGNQLIYEASVPNQNEGETIQFILNPKIREYLSFENPDHDFPKKIQYRRISNTEIEVIVLGGEGKGFSLKMRKQMP